MVQGIEMEISRASRRVNESATIGFVSECLESLYESPQNLKIGLMGLSFKGEPKVQDTRGAFSVQIVDHFASMNYEFFGYEPAGLVEIQKIRSLPSMQEVLNNCEVIIIVNRSDEFRDIPKLLSNFESTGIRLIIDMWGILINYDLPKGVQYKSWG